MKELTPEDLICTIGACPAVLEITPEALKCAFGPSCPAVFEVAGDLVIIGRVPSVAIMAQIGARVGPGELAIIIDRALLANVTSK